MDNAQVTSQMAQINTVSGIEKLNQTVQGLNGQFVQMQALQGATLVGHDVIVPGNQLAIADGVGAGRLRARRRRPMRSRSRSSARAAQVVDTHATSARSASGLHSFDWPAGSATDASGLTLPRHRDQRRDERDEHGADARPHRRRRTGGNSLTLELARSGTRRPTRSVKAFN